MTILVIARKRAQMRMLSNMDRLLSIQVGIGLGWILT